MASRLTPYIAFNGNAREAMQFYQEVFGGELASNTFAEFGEQDASYADLIMHSQLDTPGGYVLMAADTPPGMEYRPGRTVTMILHGDDEQELRGFWEGLRAGGTVITELAPQMWGDIYGECQDKFGVTWMVNISPRG